MNSSSEVAPVLVPLGKGAVTCPRELVHAAPASADLRPPARQQPSLLQPVQRRVQRALGKVECATTSGAQRFSDRVAVRRARLHRGKQEKIEVAFERLGVHPSQCYTSRRDVSRIRLKLVKSRMQSRTWVVGQFELARGIPVRFI